MPRCSPTCGRLGSPEASRWITGPGGAAHVGLIATTLTRIVWFSTWLLVVLLGLRFMLKLLAADPASRFASVVFQITFPPLIPFFTIVPTPQLGPIALEVFTFIAIVCYLLLGRAVAGFIRLFGPDPAD